MGDQIKTGNFEKILLLVYKLYYQNVPSNNSFESDIETHLKLYQQSNKINIAIIGAGPVGLFLACYLHKYYNTNYGLNDHPRVNIIIFDNRIINSGLRKPYTRRRNFAFSSSFFSYIIPKIYSWSKENKQELFMNIYILEYILFTKAYYDYNIFIFEQYNWRNIVIYLKLEF